MVNIVLERMFRISIGGFIEQDANGNFVRHANGNRALNCLDGMPRLTVGGKWKWRMSSFRCGFEPKPYAVVASTIIGTNYMT